jgi:integrase
VVEVPRALQASMGRKRFKASLGTDSLTEANKRKLPHVHEWHRQIEAARAAAGDPTAALMRDATEWRQALALSPRAEVEQEGRTHVPYDELLSTIKDLTRQVAELQGSQTADRFFKAATGSGTPLRDLVAVWVAEVVAAEQTKVQHKSTVKQFLAWAGEFATVEETDRKKAGEYVSHLLASSGLSRRTVKRHLSSLSQFWLWLESKGHEVPNVWRGHRLGKKAEGRTRQALNDEMVVRLLKGRYRTDLYRQTIHDAVRLALLHGARLDELCAMKRSEVVKRADGYWLTIPNGKTEAAARDIPVHPAALSIVKRLKEGTDEFLFPGLTPGGPDQKRSWYVSKAYGRFRKQASVGVDGKWQDFHALRNTFIAAMEGLEVPESTVKLLVGHERVSMTYGHYSKGERVRLQDAIARLDYGVAVMSHI